LSCAGSGGQRSERRGRGDGGQEEPHKPPFKQTQRSPPHGSGCDGGDTERVRTGPHPLVVRDEDAEIRA
jgi:hypothetical protein